MKIINLSSLLSKHVIFLSSYNLTQNEVFLHVCSVNLIDVNPSCTKNYKNGVGGEKSGLNSQNLSYKADP